MSPTTYKRLEQLAVIIILIGIVLMFQPWFKNIVELFDPLFPEAKLGRTYKNDIAPTILRFGFYGLFLGTIVFIVISHYTYPDIQKATRAKGGLLTFLLILGPVVYGFGVLAHLAWAYYWSVILAVFNAIFVVAVWNKKLWGIVGLDIFVLIGLALALTGNGSLPTAIVFVVWTLIINVLVWPRRATLLTSTPAHYT